MNRDHFKGLWNQFKGELKYQWAKFTDDDLLQIEGNYDKFAGKLQEKYADQKDQVIWWADRWFEQHQSNTKPTPAGGMKR